MKKSMKVLTGVALSAVLAVSLCAFAACGGDSHTHGAGTTWYSDANYHWNLCVADGCDTEGGAVMNKAAHSYDGGTVTDDGTVYTCLTCGYSYTDTSSSDDTTSGTYTPSQYLQVYTELELTSTDSNYTLLFNLTDRSVELSSGSDTVATGSWKYSEDDGVSITLDGDESTNSVSVTANDDDSTKSDISISYGNVSCSFTASLANLDNIVCVWPGTLMLGGTMDSMLTIYTDGTFMINILSSNSSTKMTHEFGGNWYYTDDDGLSLYLSNTDETGTTTYVKMPVPTADENGDFVFTYTGTTDGMTGTFTLYCNTAVLSGINNPYTAESTED